jgi:hypothetical protein
MSFGSTARAGLASIVLSALTGCAAGYSTYDPYWHDYHQWDSGENRIYLQWAISTHRPYRAYERLGLTDQRAYWAWRHTRPGRLP